MTDFFETTRRYYSNWVDFSIGQGNSYLVLVQNNRKSRPTAHLSRFCVYAVQTPDQLVISYAPDIRQQLLPLIPQLAFHQPAENVLQLLRKSLDAGFRHTRHFYFSSAGPDIRSCQSVSLGPSDWDAYWPYYQGIFPRTTDAQKESVRERFGDLCQEGYCFGRYSGHRLAAVTRCPSMPYMPDEVQKIGISTHPDHRRQGFAMDACSACLNKILADGKTPLWSCSASNHPSINLAYKLGFLPFADVFSLFGSTRIRL